jgi:DNA repair protein RadD
MNKIISTLGALSVHDLEGLVGPTIFKAVSGAYETNKERELARLVLDRYGTGLLKSKQIRAAFIDVLSTHDAELICDELNIRQESGSPHEKLMERYSASFNERKAEEFVRVFGIPDEFVPKALEEQRTSSQYVCSEYKEQLASRGVLHPYQRRVKDKVRSLLLDGRRRLMVQMPTGAGKTVTALEVIVDYMRAPDSSGLVVWIVDSNELADQALESFASLWKLRGDRPTKLYRFFGAFEDQYADCEGGVVFASFDKVWASLESSDKSKRENVEWLCKRASLVVVDEAHMSMAETYEQIIRKLISYDGSLVGLSATPGRSDAFENTSLASMYGQTLVSISDEKNIEVDDAISYLRNSGYLASVMFEEFESGATLNIANEDQLCAVLAENPERNDQIIKQIERAVDADQSSIVFACTKDHVLALMALCRAKNIDAGFIIGEVAQSERITLLNKFRTGELKVLINHQILSTGVDLPNVDKLIITRPIQSPVMYSQILGRALRGPKNGGNANNVIVNIRDNLLNFPDASDVFRYFKNNFVNVS